MKVDEGCINHNAIMKIKSVTETFYDCLEGTEVDKLWLVQMVAEVRGIIELAETLKEVLRT